MGTKGRQIVDLDINELIADLNRAYADEWLAAYAYNYMGQIVAGRPAAKFLGDLLRSASQEELEHQSELAERIVSLGGKPLADVSRLIETSNDGYPPVPTSDTDIEGMIRTVIEAERKAIEVYNQLARKTFGKDPVTYSLIIHILEEEVEHEDEFEQLVSTL